MESTDRTTALRASWEASLKIYAGPIVNAALDDPLTCEVMLNPDGRLWQERFGEPMKCIGKMHASEAEVMFRTLAALLDKAVSYDLMESIPADSAFPGRCLPWYPALLLR